MAFTAGAIAAPAHAQNNILFIFDASGSMKVAAGSESRMAVAKKAMNQALKEVPAGVRLGLLMYGHRRAGDCKDIELVSPIGADDGATINAKIQAVDAKGETPIAEALRQAARSFAALKGQNNSIVLVTDGIEECKGDPCAAAREIKAAGLDLKAHVVGFTLNDQQRKAVQCIADITGGKYFEAKDASGLNKALGEVKQQTAQVAPPPVSTVIKPPTTDDNLLSPANGGRLLLAPNTKWSALTDGKEDGAAVYAGEGVWGFKDGKPATFDALEILVPEVSANNVKDVELFVGDDGPLGTFRSVGTLTVQNIKMMNSPYQRFTLPPTTARYVKIALKTPWGGDTYVAGHEIKLRGKIDEAASPGAKPAPAAGIDLLAPANGGVLVYGRNAEWEKLTDGRPMSGATYAGEGVWRFKDGRPAELERIEVLVDGRDGYNLKEFEVLAGDESPTGAFRSLGKFSTANARLFETPYQVFPLPAATARFVKVVFLNDWGGGYVSGKGLRLYGKIDEAAVASPAPPAPAGIDLIAPANGGMLLAASQDDWKTLTDGKGTRSAGRRDGEAIWAFKDEKPATINAIEVLIPAAESYNLKDFDILVSDDAPTGPFRPVASLTTTNGRFVANGQYQRFVLPPTKARYVKVVFKTSWGDSYIAAYGLKIIGTLEP